MTTGVAPLCMLCQRLNEEDSDNFSCEAFPKGIPEDILFSRVDHRQSVEGDGGMQFAPLPRTEKELREWLELKGWEQ